MQLLPHAVHALAVTWLELQRRGQHQPCAREQGLVPGLSRLLCTKSRTGSLIAVGPLACAGCPVVFVHLEQPLPSWRWCG